MVFARRKPARPCLSYFNAIAIKTGFTIMIREPAEEAQMSSDIRLRITGFVVLVVLVVSAIFTTPALADGGTSSTGGSPTRTAPSSNTKLSQVPSGTKGVILDSQGNKLPLGSQAAQAIIASGDPIWCP